LSDRLPAWLPACPAVLLSTVLLLSQILDNQKALSEVLANQSKIMAKQVPIEANQSQLPQILANQKAIQAELAALRKQLEQVEHNQATLKHIEARLDAVSASACKCK